MQTKILEHIHASEMPARWREQLDIYPDQFVTITVDVEEDMPPEEMIRPEFIKKAEENDRNYKSEESIICETKEESDALLDKIWNV